MRPALAFFNGRQGPLDFGVAGLGPPTPDIDDPSKTPGKSRGFVR
jgi:hypothetical protein